MLGHGLERIGRAGRVIAAHLAVQRADQRAIGPQESDQQVLHDRHLVRQRPQVGVEFRVRRRRRRRAAPGPRAQQNPAAPPVQAGAPGSGVGVGASRGCGPRHCPRPCSPRTPRDAGCPVAWASRWTTRVRDPQRRPDRTVTRKASLSMSRCAAGSTSVVAAGAAVRRPGCCDPCGDEPTGSSGRRGCACAGGNRAPCDGDGCSAGTYACSRASLRCSFSWSVHSKAGQCVYGDAE